MSRDFDSPWKVVLTAQFEGFVQFFFPELHRLIDWAVPPVSLDKELQSVMREAELGESRVDNLTRVRLKTGDEAWLYIHVEVQSQHDARLAERIFSYHVRLYDLYGRHPVNLVILGDASPTWRPDEYRTSFLGRTIQLQFCTAKLLDHAGRMEELERDPNPIGMVVAAHLESLLTGGQPELRLAAKLRLVRRLYDQGVGPEEVRQMYRLIDWFIELPPELSRRFRDDLTAIEEEKKMPYLTANERLWLQEGREEGRQEGRQEALREGLEIALAAKFNDAGQIFADSHLNKLDLKTLEALMAGLRQAKSLDDVRRLIGEPQGQ